MTKCCDQFGMCARVSAIMMTIAGIVLQIIAALECEFLKFEGSLGVEGTVGLWEILPVSGVAECVDYPDDLVGSYLKSARGLLVISLIFAAIAFTLVLVEFCFCRIPCAGFCTGIVYMLAWTCGAATFSLYGSDFCTLGQVSCQLGKGGIYTIVACSLYFVSSFFVCCLPKSQGLLCGHHDSHDEVEDQHGDDAEEGPLPVVTGTEKPGDAAAPEDTGAESA